MPSMFDHIVSQAGGMLPSNRAMSQVARDIVEMGGRPGRYRAHIPVTHDFNPAGQSEFITAGQLVEALEQTADVHYSAVEDLRKDTAALGEAILTSVKKLAISIDVIYQTAFLLLIAELVKTLL